MRNVVQAATRMLQVKSLSDSGYSLTEIADKMGITYNTVAKDISRLKELSVGEIDTQFIADRRMEIDLEYLQAIEEAKEMFFKYKEGGRFIRNKKTGEIVEEPAPLIAKEYHERWTQTVAQRAKLFGLDSVKIESNTFNQYNSNTQNNNNLFPIEKSGLTEEKLDRIAQILTEE